jgi:hypothetical protein
MGRLNNEIDHHESRAGEIPPRHSQSTDRKRLT